MPPQIKVAKLSKRYGRAWAATDVSFEVASGEIFGLLGANGAGKTTILECLVGLRKPDAGELLIAGVNIRANPRRAHAHLGASLQNSDLPDHLTPREALWLFGSFNSRRANIGELLQQFALTDKADSAYCTLSVGQRQRVALALSVVNDPAVIILDEPSSGLDPQARRQLHSCLRAMKQAGKTILLSTHDLGEAADLCDRVAVLQQGRLVAVGSPLELQRSGKRRQSVRFRSDPMVDAGRLGQMAGVQTVSLVGESHRLSTSDPVATVQELNRMVIESRLQVLELQVETVGLDDIYFEITDEPKSGSPS